MKQNLAIAKTKNPELNIPDLPEINHKTNHNIQTKKTFPDNR